MKPPTALAHLKLAPRHRLPAILAAAVMAFCGWMFVHPLGIASDDAYRDNDWFTDRAFDVLARDALLHHHQLPIRSHLLGGGFPTLGHPFDGSFSPLLIPTLLLGDVLGVKVVLTLLLLAGSWGMWGLARRWAGVGPPAAALATLGFAYSGWLPSMMLVGFYAQCLYALTPAILRLLWVEADDRPTLSLLLAGGAVALTLIQAGNAALAVVWFVAVATWLKVAAETSKWLVVPALLLLLGVTAPLAFARELADWRPVAISWGVVGVLMGAVPVLRRFARALGPWVLRGAIVGAVAGVLAFGKVVAVSDLLDRGEYAHELSYGYEFWFPRTAGGERDGRLYRWPLFSEENPPPPFSDPDFYGSVPELLEGLLARTPTEGEYESFPAPSNGVPFEERPFGLAEREYMWVGITAPLLVLALLGGIAGRRRRQELAVLAVLVSGISLGPHLLPDLHFLTVKGLPRYDSIVQPIKYFNFFLVPLAAIAAALGLDRLLGGRPRAAWIAVPLLLLWPFVHNGGALAARFEHRVDAGERLPFHQVKHVGHGDWAGWDPEEIERWGREYMLRELARPEGAREYFNAKRGVGVIDWYGTLEMPERAIARRFVTPRGEWVDNPRYPGGEAWFSGPEGTIEDLEIGPTTVRAKVTTTGSTTVVFNQNHLPEFVARGGEVTEDLGRLAIRLEGSGEHEVVLKWRPPKLLAALAVSFVGFVIWCIAVARLSRRRSSGP